MTPGEVFLCVLRVSTVRIIPPIHLNFTLTLPLPEGREDEEARDFSTKQYPYGYRETLHWNVLSRFRILWPCIVNIRWREGTNKMQLISLFIIKPLSQHVSGIIMPIIRRIRPCPTACGVLPGCVDCGWLWSCGAASWAVCTVWNLHTVHTAHDAPPQDHSRVHCVKLTHSAHCSRRTSTRPQPCALCETYTQCTRLTTHLHKTTANHSLHTQSEHRMQ